MLNASRKWLIRLLESGTLAASGVPKAAKAEIGHFEDVGFIQLQKSGAGARYIIINKEAVYGLLQATGYHGEPGRLTAKARAVALQGDAHKGRDEAMLLMLSSAGHAEWSNGENTIDIASHVAQFGISSMVVRPGDQWHTKQPVGLVENLDPVIYATQYFEKVGFQGSLIYYSGWLSEKFLDWLTEIKRAPSYVIFPDYDIVGITNYLRAQNRVGNSLSIYIPDNIDELLQRFGKKLVSKASRAPIELSGDSEAIQLYHTLLETGRVLDQESLLLL